MYGTEASQDMSNSCNISILTLVMYALLVPPKFLEINDDGLVFLNQILIMNIIITNTYSRVVVNWLTKNDDIFIRSPWMPKNEYIDSVASCM